MNSTGVSGWLSPLTSGVAGLALAGVIVAMAMGADTKNTSSKGRVIAGRITLAPHDRPLRGATLNVWVEDVTEEGGEAKRLAELTIRNVSVPAPGPGKGSLHFTLGELTPVPNALYSLKVHLDVNADGEISNGDYLSMGRVNVLTPDDPARIAIVAELVK